MLFTCFSTSGMFQPRARWAEWHPVPNLAKSYGRRCPLCMRQSQRRTVSFHMLGVSANSFVKRRCPTSTWRRSLAVRCGKHHGCCPQRRGLGPLSRIRWCAQGHVSHGGPACTARILPSTASVTSLRTRLGLPKSPQMAAMHNIPKNTHSYESQ